MQGTRRLILCLLLLHPLLSGNVQGASLYVATNGNDAWSGRLEAPNAQETDGPFASLEGARDGIRRLRQAANRAPESITVLVRGGLYTQTQPFTLTRQDSGSEDAPVVYRARPGEEVRLLGGKVVTGFRPVTDPAVLNRLDPAARGKLMQADLRVLGITDYGSPAGGGLELFFQDKPMPLSRWPNLRNALSDSPEQQFVRIPDILGKAPVDVRGTKGCVEGLFAYEGDRPKRWTDEKDIWLHGYWFWDWSDQREKVHSIDVQKRVIALEPPYHGYGYRKGQWYYAYNLLSEIDEPGEWYLDRESGVLYFWPPAPLESGQAIVSVLPTLVTLKETSFVTLRGFTMEAVRGTAITVANGHGVRLAGCTIRNVGGSAIDISGGSSNGVVGCDIYQCGAGGISLSGGDRRTLAPAGQYADNNHIHHYGRWKPMYSAAIGLYGVGNRATHNLIDNAPHQAISFGGNDHLIEFNEIHSVCFESNDAGAIYAGRDWTMRGTVIRYNYLHDINGFQGRGCVGIYLDDMFCGTEMVGNVFYRVTRAAFIGGGRDCSIVNNIFVDCRPAIHVDARALGWAKYHADGWVKEGQERGTLSGTRYNQPPYRERYPRLVNILADDPEAPRGNLIARNICAGGKWDEIEAKARPLISFQDNLLGEDPHFVDRAQLNYQLREDSPAYSHGFQRIPMEKIGLYKDECRASWPVKHQVRPTSSSGKP